MDITLTRDGVSVLSHDPWVHTTLCTTASGEALGAPILIRDKTLAELQAQYLCGGVRDPDFPRVEPRAETIMTLEEVLQALKKAPQMVLYLDVKIDGEFTAGAEYYARAITKLLEAAKLPNRIYIEGPSAEAKKAQAGAVVGPTQVLLHHAVKEAREEGVQVVLFTINTREELEKYCGWPLEVLITDYQDLGHCP